MSEADPTRRAELAAIHIAAKELALGEESYRDLVERFTGGRAVSAGAMDVRERRALLDHFRRLGFTAARKGRRTRPQAPTHRPEAAKLRALWRSLWNLGVVQEPSDQALAAFVHRHTGLDAIAWTDGEQLDLCIDCLRGWCEREGYVAKPFRAAVATPQEGSFAPGLIAAQWRRLERLGAFRHGYAADIGTWLRRLGMGVSAPQFLTRDQAEEAIAALGRWLRRLSAPPEGGNDGDAA